MGRHLPSPAQAITQHWSPDTVRNIVHISTLPIRFTFTLPVEFLPGVFWRLSLRLIDAGWSDCAPDVMILLSSDCDRDTPPPAWILIPRFCVTLSLVSTDPEIMMKISDIWYPLLLYSPSCSSLCFICFTVVRLSLFRNIIISNLRSSRDISILCFVATHLKHDLR